jgi:TolB-like protein
MPLRISILTIVTTVLCMVPVTAAAGDGTPQLDQADHPRVAVLELRGKLSRGQLAVMSDKVRGGVLAAVAGKSFVVMSRENMAILLKAQGKTCEGVLGSCEVETGRNIGAAYVVSGSVEDMGSGLMLVLLKVHNTETGALTGAGDVRGTQVIELIDKLPRISMQIMTETLRRHAPAPAPMARAQPVQRKVKPDKPPPPEPRVKPRRDKPRRDKPRRGITKKTWFLVGGGVAAAVGGVLVSTTTSTAYEPGKGPNGPVEDWVKLQAVNAGGWGLVIGGAGAAGISFLGSSQGLVIQGQF